MTTDELNEQELLHRLAEGNQEAFRRIFMHYYPKIRGFILGLLKSEEDAEDLAQEIFAKLWSKRESFAEVRNLGVYLFVLSRNTAYNYIESRQVSINRMKEYDFEEADNSSPLEDLVAKDLNLLVDMVVEGMPPQRKLIYKLSRVAGLSNSEIAEKLQLTKKTVENHLNLALKELRNSILLMLVFYFC